MGLKEFLEQFIHYEVGRFTPDLMWLNFEKNGVDLVMQ